jgi:hypothetical protein
MRAKDIWALIPVPSHAVKKVVSTCIGDGRSPLRRVPFASTRFWHSTGYKYCACYSIADRKGPLVRIPLGPSASNGLDDSLLVPTTMGRHFKSKTDSPRSNAFTKDINLSGDTATDPLAIRSCSPPRSY